MRFILFLLITYSNTLTISQFEKRIEYYPKFKNWWKMKKGKYKDYVYSLCLKNQHREIKKLKKQNARKEKEKNEN